MNRNVKKNNDSVILEEAITNRLTGGFRCCLTEFGEKGKPTLFIVDYSDTRHLKCFTRAEKNIKNRTLGQL